MRFSFKSGRSTKPNLFPEGVQHPDLPLSPKPAQSTTPTAEQSGLDRRATTSERFSSGYAGDRRSIAVEPAYEFGPHDSDQDSIQYSGGLSRSQTVLRREGARRLDKSSADPSPLWSPGLAPLPPTPTTDRAEAASAPREFTIEVGDSMNQFQSAAARKTSGDSGQSPPGTDRWTQRRLQRLNTEQGFREQRQGGQSIYSPPTSLHETSGYTSAYSAQQQQQQQQAQPSHPSPSSTYQVDRSVPTNANAASVATAHTQPVSSSLRANNYSRQDTTSPYILSSQQPQQPPLPPQQSSPSDSNISTFSADSVRPGQRSLASPSPQFAQQQQHPGAADDNSMSASNNGGLSAPRTSRAGVGNRQSMHNGINPRDAANLGAAQQTGGQQAGGVAAFNASVVPPTAGQAQSYQGNPAPTADVGRTKTPQPVQTVDDMTDEEVNQLIKDHKELREKYTKVKKYYFEKEDQVKQLQNSLAHQRLSQSRTSLDDSEYTTRFNRLDGLIAQLAFAIRKSWRSIPQWLRASVNKDAVVTGKQEMIAAGRAFISCWLVEEVFEKYFHPDLDPTFSAHLKTIQRNIRHFAPFAQTAEEEEYLTSKVVNWRLSTLEGLQEELRSPQCAANRAQLTDALKQRLIAALSVHLHDPAPPDLEGGVHMIIELVVSIASHVPLESRDVVIEYFAPGDGILHDQMKIETGIPTLSASVADEAAELGEVDDGDSDDFDVQEITSSHHDSSKKKSMLSALTSAGSIRAKSSPVEPRKHGAAGNSSGNQSRPESAQGMRQDGAIPRVRMAAGIGVQIRGRSVLVKATVFPSS